MLLYGGLAVCALLAVLLVYRYDMYEREPWFMILLAAALGAGAMWLVGELEGLTIALLGDAPADSLIAAVPATHEELARLIVVAGLAIFLPKQFNDPMDGIIYGSIVGLGMAINESIFYLQLWRPEGWLLPPTEVIRLFGHLVMGGITGFAIGMARMKMPRWPRVLAACLAVSISLHYLWDLIAFASARTGSFRWSLNAAGIGLMLGGILFYGVLVVIGSDWSRQVFKPRSRRSLWGWPFTLLLSRRPRDDVQQ